jgi:hypothetical protein
VCELEEISMPPLKLAKNFHQMAILGILGFLGAIGYFSYISLDRLIAVQESSGAEIDVSGRQRMLTQRIGMLADLLVETQDRAAQRGIRLDLLEATALMAKSLDGLIEGDAAMGLPGNPSPAVRALYFGPRRFIDRDVRAYLQRARELVDKTDGGVDGLHPLAVELQEEALGPLLKDLDIVVRLYKEKGTASVASLRLRTITGTVIALILLTILALLLSRQLLERARARAWEPDALGDRRRIFILVLIMTTVAVIIAGSSIWVLYRTAFEQ